MSAPFVLTSRLSEIDREFRDIAALAAEIVALRDRWNFTRRRVIAEPTALGEAHFPGAACVRLRLAAAPSAPSITLGWAILPGYPYDTRGAAAAMAQALDAVTARKAAA